MLKGAIVYRKTFRESSKILEKGGSPKATRRIEWAGYERMLINDKKKLRPDGKGAGTRAQRQEEELDKRKRAKVAIAKMDKSRGKTKKILRAKIRDNE
jgi:hypothetical protein